jgi:hypothetical protein
MSGNPYNSILRSGFTRRLWLIIALAMLIPVSIAVLSRWFEAEERRARLQNQELSALSRDKASTLMFSASRARNFADGPMAISSWCSMARAVRRYRSSRYPKNSCRKRAPRAKPSTLRSTTILAWFAAGREWRGALITPPAISAIRTPLTPSWYSHPRRLSA